MKQTDFILCPICKNKTRLKMWEDTELKNFPHIQSIKIVLVKNRKKKDNSKMAEVLYLSGVTTFFDTISDTFKFFLIVMIFFRNLIIFLIVFCRLACRIIKIS